MVVVVLFFNGQLYKVLRLFYALFCIIVSQPDAARLRVISFNLQEAFEDSKTVFIREERKEELALPVCFVLSAE